MRKNIFLFLYFSEYVSFNTVLDYLQASGGKQKPFFQDKIGEEQTDQCISPECLNEAEDMQVQEILPSYLVGSIRQDLVGSYCPVYWTGPGGVLRS